MGQSVEYIIILHVIIFYFYIKRNQILNALSYSHLLWLND